MAHVHRVDDVRRLAGVARAIVTGDGMLRMEWARVDARSGSGMSMHRVVIAILLLALAAAATRIGGGEAGREDAALSSLPYTIGQWSGTDAPPMDAETERTLAADAVLNRTYLAE